MVRRNSYLIVHPYVSSVREQNTRILVQNLKIKATLSFIKSLEVLNQNSSIFVTLSTYKN